MTSNARKHGIDADTVRQVLDAPLRTVVQGDAVLHIGLTARRDLVEVVVTPGEPVTVLHAMRLRPANYHHLRAAARPVSVIAAPAHPRPDTAGDAPS